MCSVHQSLIGTPPALLVGCGAGFSGDRVDAAVAVVATLVSSKQPSALIFETLAERTLALAQLARSDNEEAGYEPALEQFLRPVLSQCIEHRIPIIGNFGAANPDAAARAIQRLARELGMPPLRVGIVRGDDVRQRFETSLQAHDSEGNRPWGDEALVSASAYLGATPIANCLRHGAQVVVTGRVADPALALGAMLHHFNWAEDDWDRLARGTIAGHLLECGAQVTGGYFADTSAKHVPGLDDVGFPIVAIDSDGVFTVRKAEHTGGRVDVATVLEQLLYEIHDPASYITPDVVADITQVELEQIEANQVRVTGIKGLPRPADLKVTVCTRSGWLAEGEISYAGFNALNRAKAAASIVESRIHRLHSPISDVRCDFIGEGSILLGDRESADRKSLGAEGLAADAQTLMSRDIRLRVAAHFESEARAMLAAREVLALYTCGPAGGAGVRTAVSRRLATYSEFIRRSDVIEEWSICES